MILAVGGSFAMASFLSDVARSKFNLLPFDGARIFIESAYLYLRERLRNQTNLQLGFLGFRPISKEPSLKKSRSL